MESIRLNKALSDAGFCSRRQADRFVDEGRVMINGKPAQMGQKVLESDDIVVDGKLVERSMHTEIILAFNKPVGIVCTSSKQEKDNIIDFINYPERIYPIGRLDKDSHGLILLTNNGELMDAILRGQYGHEKEYYVKVNHPIKDSHIQALEQGIPILDTMTKPCRIRKISQKEMHITLTQGLNRQIRRMCDYFDYRVVDLQRVRVMNIVLGDLPEGKYRPLTMDEVRVLKEKTAGMRYHNE